MVKKVFLALFVLLVVAIVAAGYFYFEWSKLKNDPVAVTAKENELLIEEVGRLILLPQETPTIATVTDPSKLSDQAFFINAQVGYKVLVYSKKAILYDPVLHKIIEVGPVSVTNEPSGATNGTVTQ